MIRVIFITALTLLSLNTSALFSQGGDRADIIRDSLLTFNDPVVLNFESNLDSLLQLWYVRNSAYPHVRNGFNDTTQLFLFPEYSDSDYMERLSRIPSVIDMSFNGVVKNYIDVYTRNRREQMEVMLGLSEYYFPIFEEVLDYYDVPLELKYLPVVESALNPRAVSRAGATGIWQFMLPTARMYNLTMNSLVDERRDPLASSHAAARYLKDLYGIYHDWTLALAAYNCGPGNVNRAIRRAGGARNYWAIYYYLPRETRGYVPAFIAATYAMHYFHEYGINPRNPGFPIHTDTVMINQDMHFMQLSEVMGVPVQMIRDFNPQYRQDIVPASAGSLPLRLPVDLTLEFIDFQDSVFAHRANHFLRRDQLAAAPGIAGFTADAPAGMTQVNYTVKQGDNLGFIAEWFNVRIADLRHWNNISGSLIRVGQSLRIYVRPEHRDYYVNFNSFTFQQKQAMVGRTPTVNQTASQEVANDGYIYYTVRQGDTLFRIANQFPGVSDRDIMGLNNIVNANRIFPGQRLRIRPSS